MEVKKETRIVIVLDEKEAGKLRSHMAQAEGKFSDALWDVLNDLGIDGVNDQSGEG
jgi:hypothetical protein